MNDQYHILNKNDQKNKKRLQDLLQTKEEKEKIVGLFDKRNFTFQNIITVLTLCTTIIIPIVVALMTKK